MNGFRELHLITLATFPNEDIKPNRRRKQLHTFYLNCKTLKAFQLETGTSQAFYILEGLAKTVK